jgi:hypothetical protein
MALEKSSSLAAMIRTVGFSKVIREKGLGIFPSAFKDKIGGG